MFTPVRAASVRAPVVSIVRSLQTIMRVLEAGCTTGGCRAVVMTNLVPRARSADPRSVMWTVMRGAAAAEGVLGFGVPVLMVAPRKGTPSSAS